MDAILARLSQLEDETRELKSTNARLVSTDEAHQSSIARLSSEVTELRTTVSDQGRVIADLSTRALPDGHWVWESTPGVDASGSEGQPPAGRWVWSLEKYGSPAPTGVVSIGRTASLLDLPVELITMIARSMPFREGRVLSTVCYQLLVMLLWHPAEAWMDAVRLIFFLDARIGHRRRSARITAALDPKEITLIGLNETIDLCADGSRRLDSLAFPHDTVKIETLVVELELDYCDEFQNWIPLLRFLDPSELVVQPERRLLHLKEPPSVVRVPSLCFDPLKASWTRITDVSCYGPGSVPLLVADASEAFDESSASVGFLDLIRSSTKDESRIQIRLGYMPNNACEGQPRGQDLEEEEVETALDEPPAEPAGSGESFGLFIWSEPSPD